MEASIQDLTKQILELIRLTSTDLPPIVEQPLRLVDFQPALRFAPSVEGLLRHPYDLEGRWHSLTLADPSISNFPGQSLTYKLDQDSGGRSVRNCEKDAGLPPIRFHDLRHTAASLMLNHNVPVMVVSRRLGHAKASITLVRPSDPQHAD